MTKVFSQFKASYNRLVDPSNNEPLNDIDVGTVVAIGAVCLGVACAAVYATKTGVNPIELINNFILGTPVSPPSPRP